MFRFLRILFAIELGSVTKLGMENYGASFRKRNSFCIISSYFMMNSRGFDLIIEEAREFIYLHVLFFNLNFLELIIAKLNFLP